MADTVLKGVGGGAMKGASLGATIGMNPLLLAATGGLSAAAGPIAGALVGAVGGGVKSKKAKDKIEESQGFIPPYQDPTQAARLAEIDQIAKNIQYGTDSATQTAIRQGQETTAATQSRLARVTGGNSGATVDALIKAQRAGADAGNTAIAQGQSRLPFFKDLGQQLSNRIEQRRLELGLLNRSQSLAEGAQAQKENVINSNSAIASGIGVNELGNASNRVKSLVEQMRLKKAQEGFTGGQTQEAPLPISSMIGDGGTDGATEVLNGQSLTNLSGVLPGF